MTPSLQSPMSAQTVPANMPPGPHAAALSASPRGVDSSARARVPVVPDRGTRFARVLTDLQENSASSGASDRVTVRPGQTLTALVREQWAVQGRDPAALSPAQAYRWALATARSNGLASPDLILPGQQLQVVLPAAEGPQHRFQPDPSSRSDSLVKRGRKL